MLDQKLYVKECKANWCRKNLDLVNTGRWQSLLLDSLSDPNNSNEPKMWELSMINIKNRPKTARWNDWSFPKKKEQTVKKTAYKIQEKHPIYKIILKNSGLFYVGCETAGPIIKFGGMKTFSMGQLNIARCELLRLQDPTLCNRRYRPFTDLFQDLL